MLIFTISLIINRLSVKRNFQISPLLYNIIHQKRGCINNIFEHNHLIVQNSNILTLTFYDKNL